MVEQKTRSFICFEMPSDVLKEIASIQEQLNKKLKFIGKTTELENIHLTLKFLGEINQETLEKTKKALSSINFSKSEAKLGRIEFFTYKKQPKIIWIKIISQISKLQKQIDSSLIDLFPKEERFMAHVTIARIKYIENINSAIEYIKHIKIRNLNFEISEFILKKSTLEPLQPEYKTIETYKLKDY